MQDLVLAASRGDRQAFSSLVSGSIDRLFAIARRILQDHDQADDAVQSALVDAWRDLPKLRDPARFDAWLYRLLVRSCYDEARRRRSIRAHIRQLSADLPAADDVDVVLQQDELERAFRRLTVEQRTVVVLHFYAGMPLTDIANAAGVPEGTARSRLHYALQVLRSAIEADRRPLIAQGGAA